MGSTQQRRYSSTEASSGKGRRTGGLWLGRIVNIDDPKQLNRVKVKIFDLTGELEYAWARISGVLGGNKTGFAAVPEVGTHVHVSFEGEDYNRPVILGAAWMQAGEESEIPDAARGVADPVRDARGTDTATGAGGVQLQEPADPFGGKYPTNRVYKSPSGHLIEIDDTAGAERISITHGTKQSWFEFHPDGSLVVGVKGGSHYMVVDQSSQIHIKQDHDVVVGGKFSFKATGASQLSFAVIRARINGNTQINSRGNLFAMFQQVIFEGLSSMLLKSPQVTIGPAAAPAPVVTTLTHPVDYITGIPILGLPTVLAG